MTRITDIHAQLSRIDQALNGIDGMARLMADAPAGTVCPADAAAMTPAQIGRSLHALVVNCRRSMDALYVAWVRERLH